MDDKIHTKLTKVMDGLSPEEQEALVELITENIGETSEDIDPNDVAIAAMQGLLSRPAQADTVAACIATAWNVCVPQFYRERHKYFTVTQPKMVEMAEKITAATEVKSSSAKATDDRKAG